MAKGSRTVVGLGKRDGDEVAGGSGRLPAGRDSNPPELAAG
jgi:hypothetical protein